MKTKYKLLLLIIVACVCCVAIYYNVEKVKPVTIVDDLIAMQTELENDYVLTDEDTFDNPRIIVNPYKISPLTALVMFKTNDSTIVNITVVGKDEKTTLTHSFSSTKEHYIPIYGLYAGTTNKVIISMNGKEKVLEITTDQLPEDLNKATTTISEIEELDNSFYFVTPSSDGYTAAYDIYGDVRWYLTENMIWDIQPLENGNLMLSTNRLVNSPYYTTGVVEMDYLGKIYYEYSLPGGYHHDVYEMPNGNLLLASDDFTSGYVEDYIVEIDRENGEIVKTWDLKDILKMDDGQSENWVEYDWFHNNSVWYDEKTNSITLSGRHQDAVINIDYATGTLNWIIGDKTNWSEEYHKYFFEPIGDDFEWQWSQHAAMITPEGYVFIFDNGNNKSKNEDEYVDASNSYSRGVLYKIDTVNMTIEQIWQYGKERGSEFYSPYISDVDYLNTNHYLIHSGGVVTYEGVAQNYPAGLTDYDALYSKTVEIKNDQVLFELSLDGNYYRAEKIDIYSNVNYSNASGIRLGSLGETETDNHFNLVLFNKDFDEVKDKYNIKITKEVDRLVVEGTFKKEDSVTIILNSPFSQKNYDVRISTKPYTALCVDVFNKDELTVTKYINDEGLSGKYYLFIKINGTIYDSDLYIYY